MNKNIEKTKEFLKTHFGIGASFDIIEKDILIGNRKAYMLMMDGFIKDQIMSNLVTSLQSIAPKEVRGKNLRYILEKFISYSEADITNDFNKMETLFLSGAILLFIDNEDSCIVIDAREYPIRSIDEPQLEKVTRGPRDGFVETIVFNTALIRRRIKDTKLRFELKTIGTSSKTDVAISYIDGVADSDYVEKLKNQLDNISIESLLMAEKTLVELIIPKQWYNPLPKVRFTERPDVAASHLLEGHVLIIVDTSPSVIILPVTMFHFLQHAEDFYHHPTVGSYLRILRFFAVFVSYILIPVWFLLILYPDILPSGLKFMIPEDNGNVSFFFQLLFLEFGLDLLRMSSIHTPNSLTTSLGIVSGLVLSEFAISTGWLAPEAILAIATTGLCSFAIPSIEFAFAIKIFSVFVFILTAIFKLPGFIIGNLIVFIIFYTTKNNSKYKYTYPLIPFNFKAIKNLLLRFPFKNKL